MQVKGTKQNTHTHGENKITKTKILIEDERANAKVGGNLSFVASDFGWFSFIAQMRLPLHVCAFTRLSMFECDDEK